MKREFYVDLKGCVIFVKDVKITYEIDGNFIEPFITIKDTDGGFEDGYWGGEGTTTWFGIHCEEKDITKKVKKITKERISDYQEEIKRCQDVICKLNTFLNYYSGE